MQRRDQKVPAFRTIGEERGDDRRRGPLLSWVLIVLFCTVLGAGVVFAAWAFAIPFWPWDSDYSGYWFGRLSLLTMAGGAAVGFGAGVYQCLVQWRYERSVPNKTNKRIVAVPERGGSNRPTG